MVTAYYISKLSKSNKNEIVDYYEDLLQNRPCLKPGDSSISSRCRVCLKPGTVSIFDSENLDIVEALKSYGGITVERNDDRPKNLCTNCNTFIKTAILFKERAKQTEATLKRYYLKIKSKVGATQRQGDGNETDSAEDPTGNDSEFEEKKNFQPKVTCRICGKLMNKRYYKYHLQLHDPNSKQWDCEVCGKSFKMKYIYQVHRSRHGKNVDEQTTHENVFSYKCTQCPYRGRTREYLTIHMSKHSGEYKYMCSVCPARFVFKTNLAAHMRKHREPQFKCESCKRAFHTNLLLQRHVEAEHLGILNHVCNICGKAFGYREHMTKHQKKVHKRQPFKPGRMPSYLAVMQGQDNDSHVDLPTDVINNKNPVNE